MTFDSNGSPSRSQASHSPPRRISLLSVFFVIGVTMSSAGAPPPVSKSSIIVQEQDNENEPDPLFYANAHPYVEQSLEELAKRVPELRRIQPAPDTQALPSILAKTARNVDSFF